MKMVFGTALLCLIIATFFTMQSLPEAEVGKKVLYWVSDTNPVRQDQVDAFHEWMKDNVPVEDHYELRIDSANRQQRKVVIQGVSGVGGDIIDANTEYGALQYYPQNGHH